jgi:para-aminobenzoate synthetase component 1
MRQDAPRPLRSPVQADDMAALVRTFAALPFPTVLESARRQPGTGRYSFLMADPFASLRFEGGRCHWNGEPVDADPWEFLSARLRDWPLAADPDAPPFRGGAAGYVGYETDHTLERLPTLPDDGWSVPRCWIHFYDAVLAVDHETGEAMLYSSGYPETDPTARETRARERLEHFRSLLQTMPPVPPENPPLPREAWTSNFSPEGYRQAVQAVREYIAAGDIFQANISQRFTAPLPEGYDPLAFYLRLRELNAAPHAAFLRYGELTVASASPERFLLVRGDHVETRPIKGTAPRHADPAEDTRLGTDLLASEKDRAENTMIVDLLRNDISKVCLPGTVNVPVLCGLESYASVHHLVSVVEGTLRPDEDAVTLLRASFPGGSVTGAPKKRAMEIIAELEGLPRHVYCGAIGYWGFDGNSDTSIPIRTVLFQGDRACFQVGGGVTWRSEPEAEHHETLVKADRLFHTFAP